MEITIRETTTSIKRDGGYKESKIEQKRPKSLYFCASICTKAPKFPAFMPKFVNDTANYILIRTTDYKVANELKKPELIAKLAMIQSLRISF